MKRALRITAFTFIVLLVIELIIGVGIFAKELAVDSREGHIIVDKNGNGNYKTIQEAVNNAQPGSTVFVKAGDYQEIIEISKKIVLLGENKDSTLINPISEKNKYAVRLGAPGVILKGFSIKNGAPGLYSSGIRITSPEVEIYNCDIYETPVGIVIWTSNNIISNCRFWDCNDEGITLIGSSYSECNNNKITNCVFYDNCDGVELQHSSENTIDNCEFYDNTHDGIDAIASENNNNIISNCRIYNNGVHGLYLSSSSDNQIIDCFISDNEDGNIVENNYCNNNQIITNSYSEIEEKEIKVKNKFSSLFKIIENSKIGRIITLIRSIVAF